MIPNIDPKTGIHYGVISFHSIMPEALDDIYTHGRNLSFEHALEEARKEYLSELEEKGIEETEDSFDEQNFSDNYQSDDDVYLYEKEGYILQTSSLGLYVLKSPYVTDCAPCSPCCPNAGDLDSAGEGFNYASTSLEPESFKTYCLGKDWFDDEKAPYKIETL